MTLDPLAPIRIGVRAGIGLIRFELRVIEHLLGLDREPPEPADLRPEAPADAEWEPRPAPRRRAPAEPEPLSERRIPIDAEPRLAPEPYESEHLDVEPELVAEFAEPGAEEGAGPEIRVPEPWHGYRRMRVADIRDRVAVADPAELAVIQLYESANRRRMSILDAVRRRNRALANAPR
jgi:hypothetical protein